MDIFSEIIPMILTIALILLLYLTPNKIGKSKFNNFGVIVKAIIFMALICNMIYTTFINDIKDLKVIYIVVAVLILILLCYFIFTKIRREKSKRDIVYYRDIPKNYSPAIISYFMNRMSEKKKDIIATILNLVAKGVIDINVIDNKKLQFSERDKINDLTDDEQYIYNWIFAIDKKPYSFKRWQRIIENEINEEGLIIEKRPIPTKAIFVFVLGVLAVIGLVEAFMEVESSTIFSGLAFILFLLYPLFDKVMAKVNKLNYIYSQNGKELFNKLKGLKKYFEDFTRMDEKKIKEVYIWEEYLAYALAMNTNLDYKNVNILKMPFFTEEEFRTFTEEVINSLADKLNI